MKMKRFNECLKRFTPCFCIPQRYIVGIMASLSTFAAYTQRICLSMTITEMVQKKNATLFNNTDACPIMDNNTYITVTDKDYVFEWSEEVQGHILSSFYWGYIFTHLPGALLAEKVGVKHVLGSGMLLSAILTLLTPPIIEASKGAWFILACIRFFEGMGQGVVYPCVTSIVGQWIPAKERSAISSIVFAGAMFGTVVSNGLSGILIQSTANWSVVFYFFGCLGLLWNVLWQLLVYSYPQTHPCLKPKEAAYLEQELADQVNMDKPDTPWKSILSSPRVWASVIGQLGHDWGWFTLVTDLPKYMNAVLRFNVKQSGYLLSLPYLVMFVCTISSGYLTDCLINRNILSKLWTRRIFSIIGQVLPGILIMLASYVGCNRIAAVAMFTLSLAVLGAYYPGIKVNPLDLSPNFAGTIMAICNGLGVFTGMAAPVIVGLLAPNQTMSEWRLVFWICFIILVVSTIIFVVGASVEVQSWNNPKKEGEPAQNPQ